MPSALILGGTGAVGSAAARRLLRDGWTVRLTGRNASRMPAGLREAGAGFVASDRQDRRALERVVGDGADLLVDCVCYSAEQASWLVPALPSIGRTVMISSKAVYVDAEGNHANSDVPPRFAAPIREDAPTLSPGAMPYASREGYGPNKVAAEQTLLGSGRAVTVLRPSKIHGAGALNPREWVFVKRVLDRRPAVFLAHRGASVQHTSAAANIAELIATVADAAPDARILNAADPDAPSALEISRTVACHFGWSWNEVLLAGAPTSGLRATPWDAPFPVRLDMSAATDLGYRPAGSYAETVVAELEWLAANAAVSADGFPSIDYATEDAAAAR